MNKKWNFNKINKKALSIIEVMVAIFIFTLWISSIYMVLSSTVGINKYNQDFIIASNLAREDIELVRNIRDTNYKEFQKWNMLEPEWDLSWTKDYNKVFTWSNSTNWLYKIETDFNNNKIKFYTWTYLSETNFESALKDWSNNWEDKYRLCLNNDNNYIYCKKENWVDDKADIKSKTIFYKYIEIKPLETKLSWWDIINNAFKIRSKVFWYNRWKINSTEIPTILTDWKRL